MKKQVVKESKLREFKLVSKYQTFRPHEAQSRLLDAAHFLGMNFHEFIENAIKDKLLEIELAMREEENADQDT